MNKVFHKDEQLMFKLLEIIEWGLKHLPVYPFEVVITLVNKNEFIN